MKLETVTAKVYLVGAGPGDPALLTCKAYELIKSADVIVYDALLTPDILALLPEEAETISVGKRAGNHTMPQEEINRLLLEKAQEGKMVLRLKGGDPFVFGRGGEELELLAAHGIDFEIVPGVTSAVAVPAYAGIPVTHREMTSSFHIITGHPQKDGSDRVNYQALAAMDATLVFLMGISSLPKICEGLLAAGMEKDVPATVISRGTTAGQKMVLADLSTIAEKTNNAGIKTPAIIVVGAVCNLAKRYAWAEKRPLGTVSVLVTRPEERSRELTQKLRGLGAQVIEMPMIRTEAVHDQSRFQKAIEEIQHSPAEEWLVFTSPAGVRLFFGELRRWNVDLRRLLSGTVKFAVLGAGTKKELARHGIYADLMPEEYSAAALGELLAEHFEEKDGKKDSSQKSSGKKLSSKEASPKRKLRIFRAKEGSPDLTEPLVKAGIAFEDIPIYETTYVRKEAACKKIREMLMDGELDAVTFTSTSTVTGFIKALELTEQEIWRAGFTAVCIGKKTAEAAERFGMKTLVSEKAEMDSMVELICRSFS